MVHEGWYMVQESKLWYDYIIMIRSGNADFYGFYVRYIILIKLSQLIKIESRDS